jgi:hypothetical protein
MYKIFLGSILLLFSCFAAGSVTQGLTGRITWYEGDRMPGMNRPASPGLPVSRTIFVYELTNKNEALSGDGIFYINIMTRLVKKVKSDEAGKFSLTLRPGKYSVFVKEEKGLFASVLDGAGNINPVVVYKDSTTGMNIRIDYKATY